MESRSTLVNAASEPAPRALLSRRASPRAQLERSFPFGRLVLTARGATDLELSSLWRRVVLAEHSDAVSDGRIGWAFLLDLHTVRAELGNGSFRGAIVHAQDGIGATDAFLYWDSRCLASAWAATQGTVGRVAR
jgi:hypothetical protein